MNFLLTMLICANTVQGVTCLPPIKFDILYKDGRIRVVKIIKDKYDSTGYTK